MTLEFYKVLHLIGVFTLMAGLAGLIGIRMVTNPIPPKPRRVFFLAHGVGLLIILIAGFGMAAKLGILGGEFPGWLLAKLGIWLLLGGAAVLAKRRGDLGGKLLTVFILLGGAAAYLALYKPF